MYNHLKYVLLTCFFTVNGCLAIAQPAVMYDSVYMWHYYPEPDHDPALNNSFTYDDNFNLTCFLIKKWSDNQWENLEKRVYEYDEFNNEVLSIHLVWKNGEWSNFSKSINTYSPGDKLSSTTYMSGYGTNWLNSSKTNYYYNNQGLRILETNMDWESDKWINKNRYSYFYDSQKRNNIFIEEVWEDDIWVNERKSLSLFDTLDNMVSSSHYYWKQIDSVWFENERATFKYDSLFLSQTVITQSKKTNGWSDKERSFYTKNTEGYWIFIRQDEWYKGSWLTITDINLYLNQKGEMYARTWKTWKHSWQDNPGELIHWDSTYWYTSPTVGKENLIVNDQEIISYPNPTQGLVRIKTKINPVSIHVFSSNGELIISKMNDTINNCTEIDLSELPDGIYVIKLFGRNYNQTAKVLKL